MGRSGYEFVFDGEIAAEVGELSSAAETLWTEFEEVALSALGANHAAWTRGGFDDVGVDAGFAQGMGADEAGDSGADDEDWDAGGHGVCNILSSSVGGADGSGRAVGCS